MVMLVFRGWPAESDSFLVPGHGRLRLKQSNCRQRMADDNVASGRESMEGKGGKVGGWKERMEGDKGGNKEERGRTRMKEKNNEAREDDWKERKAEKREDPMKSRPRRVVVPGFGGVGSRKGRAPRSGRTAGAGTTTRQMRLDV